MIMTFLMFLQVYGWEARHEHMLAGIKAAKHIPSFDTKKNFKIQDS